ncbi:hypothetical protein CKA32_002232 [Geitlerinema sp. FC II]|nr:hypothetical protein CKA32_002232 [Geitlerinema sp. FC II]
MPVGEHGDRWVSSLPDRSDLKSRHCSILAYEIARLSVCLKTNYSVVSVVSGVAGG